MVLDFIGNQALYLSLARGVGRAAGAGAARLPGDPASGLAGPLRAQPRRADAGQALRGRARGGLRAASGPIRRCSSTAAGCAGGCRRCSTATSARSGWSTRSRSRCPARRCCSTARRSGWPRTSRSRAATPSARRCSGRRTAASRTATSCAGRWSKARSGPQRVNVAAQRRDPDSLLNWFERLIRRRRECPELGFGDADAAGRPARRRCSPTAATGRARRSSPSTSSRASRSRSSCRSRTARRSSTCSRHAEHALPATLDLEPYAAHWFRVRRDGRAATAVGSRSRPRSLSSWRRSRLVGRALRSTPCGRVIRISATRRSRSARLSSVSA